MNDLYCQRLKNSIQMRFNSYWKSKAKWNKIPVLPQETHPVSLSTCHRRNSTLQLREGHKKISPKNLNWPSAFPSEPLSIASTLRPKSKYQNLLKKPKRKEGMNFMSKWWAKWKPWRMSWNMMERPSGCSKRKFLNWQRIWSWATST